MNLMLYDPTCGLSERIDARPGEKVVKVQWDAEYVYHYEYLFETVKSDGTLLYRYSKTVKEPWCVQ